VLKDLRDHKE
jgi:hypothetical protein